MLKKPDSEAKLHYYSTYFMFSKRKKYANRKQISGYLGLMVVDEDCFQRSLEEFFGGTGHVQHLDYDNGYTVVYVFENLLNFTNKMSEFFYM